MNFSRITLLAAVLITVCTNILPAAEPIGTLPDQEMPTARREVVDWLRCPRFFTRDNGRGNPRAGHITTQVRQIAENGGNAFRLSIYWGGEAFFQSRVAPHMPNLKDVDYLREAVDEGNRLGVRIVTYMNPNCIYDDQPLYPEVVIRQPDGTPWLVPAYGRKHNFYACVNNPKYRKMLLETIAEIFREYGPAGLYLDGLSPHVCFCPHCRARYREMFGTEMPAKFQKNGPLGVLWEMTSTPQLIGDPSDPDSYRLTRFLAQSLEDITRDVTQAAKRVKPDAAVIYHSWPKPSTLRYCDATLDEIYIRHPWHHTLWKDGEFASFGAAMPVPMLHNIYLQHKTDCEARHKMVQALAGGVYPNAWRFVGMKPIFQFIKENERYFDFNTTRSLRHVALVRELRRSSVQRTIAKTSGVSVWLGGKQCRLRIQEREPGGKIDLLCLRRDDRVPSDDEFKQLDGKNTADVLYLPGESFDPSCGKLAADQASWETGQGGGALSDGWIASRGHGIPKNPATSVVYKLPPLGERNSPWTLWARVLWPGTDSDSFFWSTSRDGGLTWQSKIDGVAMACGWQPADNWTWVRAGVSPHPPRRRSKQYDRFLSPYVGFYSLLLHGRVPMTTLHRRMIEHELTGYRVLCLANEAALGDKQIEAVERFVREGGGLIATGETSLYDELGQCRGDFALARLFGAHWRGATANPTSVGDQVDPAQQAAWRLHLDGKHEVTRGLQGACVPVVEKLIRVEPAPDAKVLGTVRGKGLPVDGLPGVIVHQYGKGRVVYFPGRIDSTFSRHLDAVSPRLIAGAVAWACRDRVPCRVTSAEGRISVRLFDQDGRRIVHLVNQSGDPIAKYEQIPSVENLTIELEVPNGKQVAAVRALWSKQALENQATDSRLRVRLPRLDEYEVIIVEWK